MNKSKVGGGKNKRKTSKAKPPLIYIPPNDSPDIFREEDEDEKVKWTTAIIDTENYLPNDEIKIKIKLCPGEKCRHPTEKNGGCNFILCSLCKTRWCWVCNKEKLGYNLRNSDSVGVDNIDKCSNRKHHSHC